MSTSDFHLVDEEKVDDSIIKRDFLKIYNQSGDYVDNENSISKIYWGKIIIFFNQLMDT